MMRKRMAWIAAAILLCSVPGAARAAYLSGSGMTNNTPEDPEDSFVFAEEYEIDPASEGDVLSPQFCMSSCPGNASGAWTGSAEFGRLSTWASAGSQQPSDGLVGSSLSVSFRDELQVSGAASGFLLIDYSLHGVLANGGSGADSMAFFAFLVGGDLLEIQFQTLAGEPSTSGPEGSFELVEGRWHYTETGTVGVALGPEPIPLEAAIRASAMCESSCSIETDLGETLRIGNARLLGEGGLPIEGEIVSDSGYDYTLPVPEPSAALSTLFGAVVLALSRRRAVLRK